MAQYLCMAVGLLLLGITACVMGGSWLPMIVVVLAAIQLFYFIAGLTGGHHK